MELLFTVNVAHMYCICGSHPAAVYRCANRLKQYGFKHKVTEMKKEAVHDVKIPAFNFLDLSKFFYQNLSKF